MKIALVKKRPYYIKYIYKIFNECSYNVQLQAVKTSIIALLYIFNQSPELQMEAIKHDPLSIMYMINPTYEVQKFICEKYINLFKFIEMYDPKIIEVALNENYKLIRYIPLATIPYKLIKQCIKKEPKIIKQFNYLPDEIIKWIYKKHCLWRKFIKSK